MPCRLGLCTSDISKHPRKWYSVTTNTWTDVSLVDSKMLFQKTSFFWSCLGQETSWVFKHWDLGVSSGKAECRQLLLKSYFDKIFAKKSWGKNFQITTLCVWHEQHHSLEKRQNLSLQKNISSNQIFGNLFCKTTLLWRNFCQKWVRENSCSFHTVSKSLKSE